MGLEDQIAEIQRQQAELLLKKRREAELTSQLIRDGHRLAREIAGQAVEALERRGILPSEEISTSLLVRAGNVQHLEGPSGWLLSPRLGLTKEGTFIQAWSQLQERPIKQLQYEWGPLRCEGEETTIMDAALCIVFYGSSSLVAYGDEVTQIMGASRRPFESVVAQCILNLTEKRGASGT